MALRRISILALIGPLLGATPAAATIVQGIEFTDPVPIEVPGGTNLLLTTSEDVYVFAPNGLFTDVLTLIAIDTLVIDAPIDTNEPFICAAPTVCDTGEFDLSSDVLLTVLDPVGSVRIEAENIVLSPSPIPEPSALALAALGVLSLAVWRRGA